MQDSVLVIGDSPFLKEIEDKVYYILDRYNSIGINRVILKYPVKNHLFTDFPLLKLTNKYPQVNTISLYLYGDLIKNPKELFSTFAFDVNKNTLEDIIQGDRLAWCGFTHDVALSYAIYKGFKKVYLIGAADFINGGHTVDSNPFHYSKELRENSVRFIEEFCAKRVQVYTCNSNSCLHVPYVPINELLT